MCWVVCWWARAVLPMPGRLLTRLMPGRLVLYACSLTACATRDRGCRLPGACVFAVPSSPAVHWRFVHRLHGIIPFTCHPPAHALLLRPPSPCCSHPLHRAPHRRRCACCAQRHAAPCDAAVHPPRGVRLRGRTGHLRLRGGDEWLHLSRHGPRRRRGTHCWTAAAAPMIVALLLSLHNMPPWVGGLPALGRTEPPGQ